MEKQHVEMGKINIQRFIAKKISFIKLEMDMF